MLVTTGCAGGAEHERRRVGDGIPGSHLDVGRAGDADGGPQPFEAVGLVGPDAGLAATATASSSWTSTGERSSPIRSTIGGSVGGEPDAAPGAARQLDARRPPDARHPGS